MQSSTRVEVEHYKLIQLEAVRGIASVIVIFHHFALAFWPGLKPTIAGTPIALLFNGEGAVTLFFLLSGFVLTRRYFDHQGGPIGIAALKRFPRLFLPACCSMLVGYVVLHFAFDLHLRAAAVTHSAWLAEFGSAGVGPDFQPTFLDALRNSFLVFLLPKGNTQYNSNLWTMFPELFGSLLCFAYAWFATKYRTKITTIVAFSAIAIGWRLHVPWIIPFSIGTLVAQLFPYRRININLYLGTCLMISGALLWTSQRYALSNVGAAIIIMTSLCCPRLATVLSGNIGSFLGKLSFPLYLVHTIAICSFVSAAFLITRSTVFAAAATLPICYLVALPFVYLEAWWVPFLNQLTKGLNSNSQA